MPPVENLEFLELGAPPVGPATELESIWATSLSQGQSRSSTNTFTHIHLLDNETGSIDLHSPDIPLLLRNFESVVMPRMASVPVTGKFAWGPMHLELALQTLAEITFLKKSVRNQAKLANLLALISISSYHLCLMGTESHHAPDHWLKLSHQSIQDANTHLRQCLGPCIRGYKSAKYKEQLIAVQALMARAWMVSDQAESRRFQVEAEKLVRLRGLAKRDISRRIRLLHHVYAWSRIVIESTYVLHDYRKFQHAMRTSVVDASTTLPQPDIGHMPEDTGLDDFLRVHCHHEVADSSLRGHKDTELSNQDIHLEDPRYGIEDQFHVIYGIPEQWLSLLSRTTRLANWMDATELPQRLRDDALMARLSRQAQSLEDAVCEFFNSHKMSTNIDANTPPNVCMSRCLTASLLIFFYRRIRNVNPVVLQPHVDEVIEGLEIFDASLARYEQPGPGSPWAAFMAGCEAIGELRRKKLRNWVDRAFDASRFETYRRAREYMVRVWERIDQSYRGQREALPRPSWMQVSREDRTWIILN
ncbi:hypothetical protein NM208_g8250 [Fusarium decemcellulare]|uniref:Uncharacterized protein n=1 Tax=Fusarium decemcellulare TaxID=57161 RepID=A0ACC1S6A6_9HYPO|nr:hypothetical protein NM208_g8250 [Fusarium decemcellulare]